MSLEKLKQDKELAKLIEEYGELELEKSGEPFQRLVTSIINQQLSTQSAESIREKVFDRFEVVPEKILEADEEELADCGLSRQKIEYVRSAAEQFIEHDLSPGKFEEMSDEEVIEELTDIHGVGEWHSKLLPQFARS